MESPLRPHDLLWLKPGAVLEPAALPPWAAQRLEQGVPVVVRRGPRTEGQVPAGIRGDQRSQRQAILLSSSAVARVVTPEELRGLSPLPDRAGLPAFRSLALLPGRLPSGAVWGPTGSAGFELASGAATVTEDSDLDLLLRCPEPVSVATAKAWLEACADLPARCDIQLDTGRGGIALAEWAAGRTQVLLKTDSGPLLVGDPWAGTP